MVCAGQLDGLLGWYIGGNKEVEVGRNRDLIVYISKMGVAIGQGPPLHKSACIPVIRKELFCCLGGSPRRPRMPSRVRSRGTGGERGGGEEGSER